MAASQESQIRASETYDDTLDNTQAEVTPTSLQADMNMVRTLLRKIIGSAGSWFDTPATDLAALAASTTPADLATHIADATVHFTEASIDHANILNVGTNTHAQLDAHLVDTFNPHGVTLAQVGAAAAVHAHVAADVTDFNAAVTLVPAVAANTAKIGAGGSIDSHSDVSTTGINVPNINDILHWDGVCWQPVAPSGGTGSGDVVGPGSSTDNFIPVFDGVTGKLIKEPTTSAIVASNLLVDTGWISAGHQLRLGDTEAAPIAIAGFGQVFVDPADGVLKIRKSTGDGSALVSLEAGAASGKSLIHKAFTPAALQTVFTLDQAPTGQTLGFVNGMEFTEGDDFNVVGTTFTWIPATAGFTLDGNDDLDVYSEV